MLKKVFLVGSVLLLACSIMAACNQPVQSPRAPVTPQPPTQIENQPPKEAPPPEKTSDESEWNIVQTFTGKDSKTTSPFHISGTKWRLAWKVDTQYPEYTVFEILVYPEGKSGMLTNRISYSKSATSDTAYIYEGKRDYYLKVIAANLSNWTITVEDYASQTSTFPVQITHIHYKGRDYIRSHEMGYDIVEADEYVEIKNLSDSQQHIAGWVLKNISKGYPAFIFPIFTPCSCSWYNTWGDCVKNCYPPRSCAIDPYKSIRVYTGEVHPESGGFCFYYFPGDIWNNELPDIAVLYNLDSQEVSRKSYIIPTKTSSPASK